MAVMPKIAAVKRDGDNDAISMSHLISSHLISIFLRFLLPLFSSWDLEEIETNSDPVLTFILFTLNTMMSSVGKQKYR